MKKTISILLIVAMMLASLLAIIPASAAPAGTAIKNATDFANMAADGTYYLENDIVIKASYDKDFKGTLDGNGKTITILAATPAFKKIAAGTVKNLNIDMDLSVAGPDGYFGALARYASGTFTNINVNIDVTFTGTATSDSIGGLIGQVEGATTIDGVKTSGSIAHTTAKADSDNCQLGMGGIVGATSTDKAVNIKNSVASVNLYGNLSRMGLGGIVGASNGNTKLVIENTQNYGNIDTSLTKPGGAHAGVAGFVGIMNANSNAGASIEIYNSRNYGNVSTHASGADMMAGGFIGRIYGGTKVIVDGCVNSGNVNNGGSGWSASGGIVANAETYNFSWSKNATLECKITNCINLGNVSCSSTDGSSAAAGIMGSALQVNTPNAKVEITNCANYGNANGNNTAGIFGYQGTQGGGNKLVIKDCYNKGEAAAGIVNRISQAWYVPGQNNDLLVPVTVGDKQVPTRVYEIPEIINCVNEGNASNGIIRSYEFTDYAEADSPMANSKVTITNCVTKTGSVSPTGNTYAVTAPTDADATVEAVKAAIPGNPSALDNVLADYDGFVGDDYVSGWDTFEPVYKAALADANKATAQATLDAHIEAVLTAADALELKEVDLAPLTAAVEAADAALAEAGDGSDYTPLTWETFTLALATAKDVLDQADAIDGAELKPSTVINATSKLNAALAGLALVPTAEKAELKNAIDTYEAYNEAIYVSASWANLVEVIAAVKVVYEDVNATAADVNAAKAELDAAAAALGVKANPSSLGAKANKIIKDYPSTPYTAKSYNELRNLVNQINNVVSANDVSQAEIDELSAALDAAVANLVKKGNFDAIDALLEPFGEIVIAGARPQVNKDIVEELKDKYTRDTLKDFTNVLEEVALAKKQDSIPNFTVEAAAKLEAALKEAIDGLVHFADYTEIDAKLAEVAALDKTKYTADSWKAVQAAINAIETLKSNRNAIQADADAALAALNTAVEGLAEATATNDAPAADEGGCKSAIGATIVVMTATLALGATTLLKKKED